jgi:glucokinase
VVTIGLDLGGGSVQAIAMADEQVLGEARLKTPTTGDRTAVLDVLAAAVHQVVGAADVAAADVRAVGVGTPGVVIDGTVGGASNMPGFLERFALADLLEQRVERPVHVINDVSAAAIAEHRVGAGRGTEHLLCVFVGTGVGGGLVLAGRPYLGGSGGAGEFGHMIVERGGAVCPCGRRGCVEAYAGRRAIALAAERAHADGRATVLFDVMREQGEERVTSGVVAEALARGDELVADLVDAAVDALGTGIAAAVNLLDVEAVVLGGGLADRLGAPLLTRVDAVVRPLLFLQPPQVHVVGAELGPRAGSLGAALFAADAV